LLPQNRWSGFLKKGASFGFLPRQADALAFAREARALLLRHQPSGVEVDVAIGDFEFDEQMVARAKPLRVSGITVPLPTPEDLIVMKAVARREQDLRDIEGLLDAHPNIDMQHIRHWVRSFAELLEAPVIYSDLDRRLRDRVKPGKRKKKK
jgi:predicted nucleotidyltransferase